MSRQLCEWLQRSLAGRAALSATRGYGRHATSQLSAAISYRVLFSLVPLAAVIIAIADALLPDTQRNAVARWLLSVVPGQALDSSVEHALTGSRVSPTAAGVVSLLVLVWAASAMMAAIRVAFRVIWENDLRRTYMRSKLLDFALVLGVGLLAVASLGATLLVQVLAEIGRDLSHAVGADTEGKVLAKAAELLASGASTFVVLVVLYRTVPPVAPRIGAIWLPALLAAVGFHVATAVYALYLARYGDVTAVPGRAGSRRSASRSSRPLRGSKDVSLGIPYAATKAEALSGCVVARRSWCRVGVLPSSLGVLLGRLRVGGRVAARAGTARAQHVTRASPRTAWRCNTRGTRALGDTSHGQRPPDRVDRHFNRVPVIETTRGRRAHARLRPWDRRRAESKSGVALSPSCPDEGGEVNARSSGCQLAIRDDFRRPARSMSPC